MQYGNPVSPRYHGPFQVIGETAQAFEKFGVCPPPAATDDRLLAREEFAGFFQGVNQKHRLTSSNRDEKPSPSADDGVIRQDDYMKLD
jgi:hypothetical protein